MNDYDGGSITRLPDGRYLVVGEAVSEQYANRRGVQVDGDEYAAVLPARVIEAIMTAAPDARIADLQERVGELCTENEGLFRSYSIEKSGRLLANDAFEEVRGERDRLAERVRELEIAAEPHCGAMGGPSVCGANAGQPCGPCLLPPGHSTRYHKDRHGWFEEVPAGGEG